MKKDIDLTKLVNLEEDKILRKKNILKEIITERLNEELERGNYIRSKINEFVNEICYFDANPNFFFTFRIISFANINLEKPLSKKEILKELQKMYLGISYATLERRLITTIQYFLSYKLIQYYEIRKTYYFFLTINGLRLSYLLFNDNKKLNFENIFDKISNNKRLFKSFLESLDFTQEDYFIEEFKCFEETNTLNQQDEFFIDDEINDIENDYHYEPTYEMDIISNKEWFVEAFERLKRLEYTLDYIKKILELREKIRKRKKKRKRKIKQEILLTKKQKKEAT